MKQSELGDLMSREGVQILMDRASPKGPDEGLPSERLDVRIARLGDAGQQPGEDARRRLD